MGFKGFSASYVAVDPLEDDFDGMNSDSTEVDATPFPGSLRTMYSSRGDFDEDEDEEDGDGDGETETEVEETYGSNGFDVSTNKIKSNGIPSSEAID